ncbi:hypothetical protein [Nesterenkonia alba]|uniref:hypothetical protein n=1 Tax=Nesterenkonia alba TaxID=515814 RepID=UPI0003B3B551|nr:hypothetical protein [Nesterenkonia alba]
MKRTVLPGLLALGCGLVLFIVLWANDLAPGPWSAGVAFAVVAAGVGVVVVFTVLEHRRAVVEPEWFSGDPREPDRHRAEADLRLARLRYLLRDAVAGENGVVETHEVITRLATAALRARGIDPETDPEAARAALGEELSDYLATEPEPGQPVSESTLTHAVTRIEEL